MYEKAFKLLIAGTIISTISYPVAKYVTKYDFKILCSFFFLGYILFFIAFAKLKKENLHFKKSMYFTLCIIPIALFNFFHKSIVFHMGLDVPKVLTLTLDAVLAILDLMMIFDMFMGTVEIAETKGEFDIKDKSKKLWQMNITLVVLLSLAGIFILLPPLSIILLLGLFIYTIYVQVKTILLFNECAKRFKIENK
ncbi:hypothetical protein OW763_14440 [Clostridium aestuarii]|uniref:DUF1211 domain-containing protein n=1 Tax=Clostridium aestuarii TaxID=338193 RepID=A0ABT4D5S4_9CLOT|nr:hypothetical protein [Clostridium aestuarii]MCY6485530.1 hypothetical protein [Clostridium aestuarii]